MRSLALPFTLLAFLCYGSMYAQAPSLTVHGIPTGATFTAGDTVTWVITVPSGGEVSNELWVDVDSNGTVNPGIDRSIFLFSQQDGALSTDGPGDDDGTVNGIITTTFALGLAPADWIFVTSNGSGSDTSTFHVLRLSSPVATVSGSVTTPGGVSNAYIIIEASPDGLDGQIFWQALTDVSGAYVIEFGGDAIALNPWRIRLDTDRLEGGLVAVRRDTSVTLGGTPPVVNFTIQQGTVLTGRVVDQLGAALAEVQPHTHLASDPNAGGGSNVSTDGDGRYWLAVPAGTYLLHFTKEGYKDQWWNSQTSSQTATQIVVTTQDTISGLDGMLIRAGLIRGRVTYLGDPVRAEVRLFDTDSSDRGWTESRSDGTYGFTVDPGTYYVRFEYQGVVQWYNNTTVYPPTGITVSGTETIDNIGATFGTTSVTKTEALPDAFTLRQNYPNPFNPATTVSFDVPWMARVRIAVFNILGVEVATLVNGTLSAGTHTVTFDASGLPSGLYFLQLQSGEFNAVRKMALIR